MFLLFAAVQIFFKHLSKIVYLSDGIENDVPEYLRRHECKFFHYFISPSCIKFKITFGNCPTRGALTVGAFTNAKGNFKAFVQIDELFNNVKSSLLKNLAENC